VYKIAVRSTGVRQLAREARNTSRAIGWPAWRNHVVEQSLVTPFLVRSRFHPASANSATTANVMIRFIRERLAEALGAPRSSAEELLSAQQTALGLSEDLGHDLFSRYRQLVAGGLFGFDVPCTPMHGDFTPQNALVDGDTLFLVDWEYANAAGSVLFDAWFLRRSLVREAERAGTPVPTFAELDRDIDAFGLRWDQVEAFGHAMHALMDFARLHARGGGAGALPDSVRELERLAGGASGSTAGGDSGAA
jgi:hypothetical protein